MKIDWTHIAIHQSATPDGDELDFDNFRRYHIQDRLWKDVGYNYGVDRVHQDYEVVVGRPLTMTGAHAIGWNDRAIGIVYAGNYNLAPPPLEMLQVSVYRLIKPLMVYHDITKDRIVGHKDTQRPGYTECPGRLFNMERLRDLI